MSAFNGINFHVTKSISNILDELFDGMSDTLLSPEWRRLRDGKNIVFTHFPENSLPGLFREAINTNHLKPYENELLKKLVLNSSEYVESLRSKVKAELSSNIDAYIQQSALNKVLPSKDVVQDMVRDSLVEAGNHFKLISDAEATKIRNIGRAVDIARQGASIGVEDPDVYFVVVRDDVTCEWCIKNHLDTDGVTPKIFKLSQVKMTYLDKEEKKNGDVSCSGQHPNCRCSLQQLPPGFGFNEKGRLKYVGRKETP